MNSAYERIRAPRHEVAWILPKMTFFGRMSTLKCAPFQSSSALRRFMQFYQRILIRAKPFHSAAFAFNAET